MQAISEYNIGVKYLNNNRHLKAVPYFKKALKLWPFKEAHLNLANCYKFLHKDDLAKEHYLLANDPKLPYSDGKFSDDYDLALSNMGLLAYKYEEDDVACELYRRALKANPKNFNAMFNLAIARLRRICTGENLDWVTSWQLYRARFNMDGSSSILKGSKKGIIQLTVETMNEKVSPDCTDNPRAVVVFSEQGFGDALMFARYIPFLKERFDKIWVQCDPSAAELFRSLGYLTCFDTIETDAGYGVAFGDLPALFMEMPNGVLFPAIDRGSSIGCVWAGNPGHANNVNRSCNSSYFRGLSEFGELISLNPTTQNERGFKKAFNTDKPTWMDTIRVLEKCSVVVTVDTSIAHLCGVLDFPCYVIMPYADPDFRWGRSSLGLDNCWYNSVRVIRNKQSWVNAFAEVRNELSRSA